MSGLLDTVPIAALSQSRTLFELGLVAVLAAAAPLSAKSSGCLRSWCCSPWGSVQARSMRWIPTPCLASN